MNGGSEIEQAIEAKLLPHRELTRRLVEAAERLVAAEKDVIVGEMIREQLRPSYIDTASSKTRDAVIAELRSIVGELAPPVAPAAPKRSVVVRRSATIDEQKSARRLLREVERVSPLENHRSLVPRLRMLVAEIRELMTPLNPADDAYGTCYGALDRARTLHRQSGMRHAVCGLHLEEAQQSWDEIRQAAQRILNQVDHPNAPSLRASLSMIAGGKR